MLHASVTALLEALAAIERQIARLDEQRKGLARRSPVRRRLMSVPAAGPSVALSSCRRPRNPLRRKRSVGAYLGLTTRRYILRGGRDSAPIRLKFFAAEGSVIRL